MRPYSTDLRRRVVAACDRKDGRQVEIAERFGTCDKVGSDFVCSGIFNPGDPCTADSDCVKQVNLFHEAIVPEGSYEVRTVVVYIPEESPGCISAAMHVATGMWGDLVLDCTTNPCGPPDGSVDIVTDVTTALEKFRNLITSPAKARTDVEPALVDMQVNISDVTFILDVFSGVSYPLAVFGGCP